MPEGPECRRFALSLAERLSGRMLKSIEVISGRYFDKPPTGLEEFQGQLPIAVVGVGVHGKFLYWILKDELSIWNTLGMSGDWSDVQKKHSRVKFVLNDGDVFFNDMRNFGTLKFVRGKYRLLEKLKSLGPDMLAQDVSDEEFIKRFRRRPHWQITTALMNQSVIAGVGNYIKAESLWLARISPHRILKEITDAELAALNRSIRQVMHESFNTEGTTVRTYSDEAGNLNEYNRRYLVYNQKSDPDGNEVVKELTADKRMTHWCPAVQY